MKLKEREINRYWREKSRNYSQRNRPDLRVRQVTKDFLTKKEALKEVSGGKEDYLEELLTDLFDNIRNILTGEGIAQIKAKRRAGER